MMNCTLSCFHRVIDGTEASKFLVYLKLYREDTQQMLV